MKKGDTYQNFGCTWVVDDRNGRGIDRFYGRGGMSSEKNYQRKARFRQTGRNL